MSLTPIFNLFTAKYADKVFSHQLKAVVMWEDTIDETIASRCSCPVYSWSYFLELGFAVPDEEVELRGRNIKPGNCSTLIYTSGTFSSDLYV